MSWKEIQAAHPDKNIPVFMLRRNRGTRYSIAPHIKTIGYEPNLDASDALDRELKRIEWNYIIDRRLKKIGKLIRVLKVENDIFETNYPELDGWSIDGMEDSREVDVDDDLCTTCTHDIEWYWEVNDARMG